MSTMHKTILSLLLALPMAVYPADVLENKTNETLLQELNSKDSWTREQAAFFLGHRHAPAAVPRLIQMVESPIETDRVKMEALYALGKIGGEEASKELIKTLFNRKKQSNEVRAIAAAALGEMGDPKNLPSLNLALEQEPEVAVKWKIIEAHGKIGSPQSVRILSEYMKPAQPLILKTAAVQAMAALSIPESYYPLQRLLKDSNDLELRLLIAKSYGKMREKRAAGALLEAIAEAPGLINPQIPGSAQKAKEVQIESLKALGEIASPAAFPDLFKYFNDPDPDIRYEAIVAARKIKDPASKEALIKAIDQLTRDFNTNAFPESAKATGKNLQAPHDHHFIQNAETRAEALRALNDIAPAAALTLLQNAAKELSAKELETWHPKKIAAAKRLRTEAIVILGESGGARTTHYLIEQRLFADPDYQVRKEAIEALEKLQSKETLLPMVYVLQHDSSPVLRRIAARSLGDSGDPGAKNALVQALSDKSPWVVIEAMRALGDLDAKEAIGPIRETAAASQNKFLKEAGNEVLKKLSAS